ncbi:hypothetical protein H6G80_21300 [Nostoc sp. FACHB-87]|uniref:hypothetical protein n=1 Tax=Nostocales TaxID=1161 RepID=UPI001685748B|nr:MULTISPECIES: hypothetical protein [Nostocales]MBD2302185.1 hypothetical protein [Nostoc sp. FACHB-190]MBD2456603.1 hypothetical protein [Nostoc sp. FACHB-87]MBD2477951.1 hypothetical protein [Anabaena sp. FACHB-83]MBD2489924.1 hypothetical protein [Aulosira sp. FACHB-615]
MFHWQEVIGIVAGFLSLLGFLPYIFSIYQRKTRPNRVTWWIWTVVGFILCFSYYSSGAVNTIWVPVCSAIGHLTIAILGIKYGEGGWNRFDRWCLLTAGLSLILWWRFSSPSIALMINICIDFLGALPTIRKSYYQPHTEDIFTWSIFLLAHTLNLFALKNWSFNLSVYPLYLFGSTFTIFLLLSRTQIHSQVNLYKRRRSIKI